MASAASYWWLSQRQSCTKGQVAFTVAVCFMVGTIFLIVGFFARSCGTGSGSGDSSAAEAFAKLTREADPRMRELSLARLSAERIRQHLKGIAAKPHVAIQEVDHARQYIEAHWGRVFGGNARVQVVSSRYSVLLSRAKPGATPEERTRFEIRSADNTAVQFTSQTVEQPLTERDNDTEIPAPILAYAPSGDITTDRVVYANYGTETDIAYLTRTLLINLTGSVLLTRYGQSGRGAKAVTAAKFGASGVLIFSDPADVAKNQGAVYPGGWWMPPTGAQKGSAMLDSGDPTTPGYPSLDGAYRYDAAARGVFPLLPMYPIGYADARAIIDSLDGLEAPSSWRVNISGMNTSRPMRLGPSLTGGRRFRLVVSQENYLKNITNVCASIRGDIEPDRWLMIGNHRDAWGYGAVDPSSGTAVLMELSQVLAEMLAEGWKPRRSIKLCTWDGEEHGLIGSWEYVEEHLMTLKDSLVAYVNIDIAVAGNYSMRTSAVPCLRTFAKSLMDSLPEEVNPGSSMGQTWSERWAKGKGAMEGMATPLGGSDYTAFIELAGIPVLDIMFRADPAQSGLYPMYHARYETFEYVDQFIDPGFKAHLSSARLLTEVTRQLADEYVLPYALNMSNMAQEIGTFFASVNASEQISGQPSLADAVRALGESVALLRLRTASWDAQTVDRRSPVSVRWLNDNAMRAMQAFLAGRGQPRRPFVPNLVFASPKYSSSSGVRFPGLSDLLFELGNGLPGALVQDVEQQLRDLAYHVRSAAGLLTL